MRRRVACQEDVVSKGSTLERSEPLPASSVVTSAMSGAMLSPTDTATLLESGDQLGISSPVLRAKNQRPRAIPSAVKVSVVPEKRGRSPGTPWLHRAILLPSRNPLRKSYALAHAEEYPFGESIPNAGRVGTVVSGGRSSDHRGLCDLAWGVGIGRFGR